MQLHNLSIKLFAQAQPALSLDAFIPLFHQWIRDKSVDGLLLDVADYKHVHQGPGIMLLGHECDYAIDMGRGKPGLMYRHKRELSGSFAERVELVLKRAAKAASLIEEAGLAAFDTGQAELLVYDRIAAPNTAETLSSFTPALQAALSPHLGEISCAAANADPRGLFGVHITAASAPALQALV